jgi:lambda family phage portal protein
VTEITILDADGAPMLPAKRKISASLAGNPGDAPYEAASIYSDHTAAWRPYLWSPDTELNPFRDRIVARVRDLVRNDGWASGGVTRILDSVIGGTFRPKSKPDYRVLEHMTGNTGFDAKWAHEFGRAAEAHYRTWANDPGRYCDAARNLTMPAMLRLAFRHLIVDGDALAVAQWLPERVRPGKAKYATAMQLIDPDRLSNPQLLFDSQTMRGGVAVDELGATTGYHIRRAHQGDWWSAANSLHWDLVPRETSWGRPVVIHHYEHDRAGQHRGGAGIFTPILARMKMLAKYDSTELDAAIVNSIFGAYIESPFDHSILQDTIGETENLNLYQSARVDFHKERRTMLGGVAMPTLFPGEKINMVAATRPSGNFGQFQGAFLRNAAAALGVSAQQMSQDWSDTNYSSARAALLEAWKTLSRRRHDFSVGFAGQVWVAWLEEAMEMHDLPMPGGELPDFIEARQAYAAARWLGPGRGWVDPEKEKAGSILGIAAGLSTLEDEVAENTGGDWEENADQMNVVAEYYDSIGLAPPNWAALQKASAVPNPADGPIDGTGKQPIAKKPEAVR